MLSETWLLSGYHDIYVLEPPTLGTDPTSHI
jgi:hypothetical protein